MDRRLAWILVATALTGLLFASVATSGSVNLWRGPQFDVTPAENAPIPVESPDELVLEPLPLDDDEGPSLELPAWLDAIFQVLLTMIGIVALIAVAVFAWRERPRLRWRRKARGATDFEVLPDVAAAVVDEVEAQRAALLEGAPRNAIVRCWLTLERDVAAAGLARHPADTSVEFTKRVLARYSVDSEAIHDLAGLYREARFSDHPLGEPARQAALDALDRLHEGLRQRIRGAREPVSGPSS